MRAPVATLGVALLLVIGGPRPAGRTLGAQAPAGPAAGAERPRLVVFISVDQFRRDYYERYGHRWTRGLARLFKDGASFPESAYPYFHTITCAGHATMSTGDVSGASRAADERVVGLGDAQGRRRAPTIPESRASATGPER